MIKEYRHPADATASSIQTLQQLLDTVPLKIRTIQPDEFSRKPGPDKWSKKQILGHLIDSATNNHHRFIRAQFDHQPTILYDQDKWNKHGYYDQMEADHIISFWEMYNRHLLELVRRIPPEQMNRECMMGDGSTRTIAWLFDDYVRHMEHHLKQIFPEESEG